MSSRKYDKIVASNLQTRWMNATNSMLVAASEILSLNFIADANDAVLATL